MTNLQKAIELTGRNEKDLLENECPLNVGIIPKRNCDEQCTYCWEEEFYATIPECFELCTCKTCQKYEAVECINEKNECQDKCPLFKGN